MQNHLERRTSAALLFLALLSAFTAVAGPNLTPYQPAGWSDKIIVTRTNGSVIDSPNLLNTDSFYIDWSIINNGNVNITTPFYVALYIDGVSNSAIQISSLGQNSYTYITGYPIGSLTPGTHTIGIIADATGVVAENNEADNSYTKTITVNAVVLPAPTLSLPANGTTNQWVVPTFAWSAVTNAFGYRILIATNASDLPSSSNATNGGASVVLNNVTPSNVFSPTVLLSSNTTYYWEVHAVEQNSEYGSWSAVKTFTTGAVPNGLTIIPTFDNSITSDPNAATIEATINAAIAVYRANISNPITVTITFTEMSGGLGLNSTYYQTYSYSTYRAALVSHATSSDDALALAHIPSGTSNPVNGNSQLDLFLPLARALGLANSSTPAGDTDSIIYLNTSIMNLSSATTDPNKYSLFATVCHETDEALGFGSALNSLANGNAAPTGSIEPEDLFRYDQNGNRSLTTSLSATSFFSFDGTNDLAQFNQFDGGDFSDWYSYNATVAPQVQDAFAPPGVDPILGVELRCLDAIGYTRVLPSTNVTPVLLTGASASAGNFHFLLSGPLGTNYVVQYSSNFVTWTPLSTNTIPVAGVTNVSTPISANPHRFYRTVSQ